VNIFNSTESSGVIDFGATIDQLDTVTQPVDTTPSNIVLNANKIEFTAYFVDASGNEQYCSQTGEFTF